MMENFILYLFIVVFIVQAMGRIAILILASWYDVRHIKHPPKRDLPHKRRPLVTAIVLAQDHHASIGICLASVAQRSYRKVGVIVVDNASADGTKEVVEAFKKEYPKLTVSIIKKRKRTNRRLAYQAALQKANGELILFLDGGTVLSHDTIKGAVSRFLVPKRLAIDALLLAKRVQPYPSIFALLKRFEYVVNAQAEKARNALNRMSNAIYEPGVMYWRTQLSELMAAEKYAGRKEIVTAYDSFNVVDVISEPSLRSFYHDSYYQSYAARLRLNGQSAVWNKLLSIGVFISVVVRIAEPFMVAYFFYLAFTFRSSTLFLLSWVSLIVWLGAAVLSIDKMKHAAKFRLIILLPVTAVLFYIKSVCVAVILLIKLGSFGKYPKSLYRGRAVS